MGGESTTTGTPSEDDGRLASRLVTSKWLPFWTPSRRWVTAHGPVVDYSIRKNVEQLQLTCFALGNSGSGGWMSGLNDWYVKLPSECFISYKLESFE